MSPILDEIREFLWLNARPLLDAFAKRCAASDPMVHYRVDRHSNDASLLTGYISIFKDAVMGDELAIMFNAFSVGDNGVALSSDVCMDNGEILAVGPKVTFQLSAMSSIGECPLVTWLRRFENFLLEIEINVINRIKML